MKTQAQKTDTAPRATKTPPRMETYDYDGKPRATKSSVLSTKKKKKHSSRRPHSSLRKTPSAGEKELKMPPRSCKAQAERQELRMAARSGSPNHHGPSPHRGHRDTTREGEHGSSNTEEWSTNSVVGQNYVSDSMLSSHHKPGAFQVGGTISDTDEITTFTNHDEEAPPPPPLPETYPSDMNERGLVSAQLVKDQEVVSAVPSVPWFRQRKNQNRLAAATFMVFGIVLVLVGVIVGLAARDGSSSSSAPSNDMCVNGDVLSIPGSIQGSTIDASLDSVVECGDATGGETKGVWYVLEGTGKTITLSTCNDDTALDTQISVFSGDCSSLKCVDGNNDGGNDCGLQSRVNWLASLDETYRVLVHGRTTNVEGNFRLDVNELANDICQGSIGPLPIPSSTKNSTIAASKGNDADCGNAYGGSGPSLWYTVVGNGNGLSVSTCNSETTLDTQLSVFSGDCSTLQCVGGNRNACGKQSRVAWASVPGVVYSIIVQGELDEVGDFQVGDFQLDVEDLGQLLENDLCEGAIGPVAIPSSTEGSTTRATVDSVANCGSAYGGGGPGLWYAIEGTGNILSVSTCGGASFATQISVFTGACSNLRCVTGNFKACGVQSRASWPSMLGETYKVLIHGGWGETGDFEFNVEDLGAPEENDLCQDATSLLSLPSSIEGSTTAATMDSVVDCGTALSDGSPGLWYSIVGTGNILSASTCDDRTNYNTQISVFSGRCDGLACVAGNDNACGGWGSRVTWVSNPSETYNILVHGSQMDTTSSSSIGDFRLSIQDLGAPLENDLCDGALGPLSIPSSTQGSTIAATLDTVVDCGSASPARGGEAPGLWYTVVGTGNKMFAETCDPATDFDTQISVFSGSCTDLLCVNGNDDWCGPGYMQSRVLWDSNLGDTYYVLVHGVHVYIPIGFEEVGDFILKIGEE